MTDYKISVYINFDVKSEKYNKLLKFEESFSMKKFDDKVEEIDYEKNIKNNLVGIITQKLISQLMLNK